MAESRQPAAGLASDICVVRDEAELDGLRALLQQLARLELEGVPLIRGTAGRRAVLLHEAGWKPQAPVGSRSV